MTLQNEVSLTKDTRRLINWPCSSFDFPPVGYAMYNTAHYRYLCWLTILPRSEDEIGSLVPVNCSTSQRDGGCMIGGHEFSTRLFISPFLFCQGLVFGPCWQRTNMLKSRENKSTSKKGLNAPVCHKPWWWPLVFSFDRHSLQVRQYGYPGIILATTLRIYYKVPYQMVRVFFQAPSLCVSSHYYSINERQDLIRHLCLVTLVSHTKSLC